MIKENDINQAQKLGYLVNLPSKVAVEQINQHFQGINLFTLLMELENLLGPHTEPPAYKRLIIDTVPEPRFQIIYLSSNYTDTDKGLTLSRIFKYEQDRLIVKHDYLVLPESVRGKGIGSKVLGAWLDQYLSMNVKEIHVHAGLKDGCLVWAKVGFKGLYRFEMERILQSAEKILSKPERAGDLIVVKAIFNQYYSVAPDGRAFPIIRWAGIGSMEPVLRLAQNNWHGWIDLTNPLELLNFKINVGR